MADILKNLGISRKRWSSENLTAANDITQGSSFMWGAEATTVATLLGTGRRAARSKQQIYDKWATMEADPICSSALSLLVTTSLGGHESTGQAVFIEPSADAEKDKKLMSIVEDIEEDLSDLLNRIAYTSAYTGTAFGDAYSRIYTEEKKGIVDLYCDELVRPPLIQPFEQGSKTIGYALYIGERSFEKLDVSQLARLKMPRSQWVPQNAVIEKAIRTTLTENNLGNLPILPAMVGGSFLYNAEEAYDNLIASLTGLVGQRWMDSIDEQMVSVNMDSMTKDQQKIFIDALKKMLTKSKELAETAIKEGRPIMERVRHIVPTNGEKQVTNITQPTGAGRNGTITIDDVMLHARLLSGALGVDLSMLGFADQLSGGLGDGGVFRVSAQVAEKTRVIRVALIEYFNHIIDIHTLKKYGIVFPKKNRPWQVNFYGSISSLEAEKQRTRSESMNAGMLFVQAMQMLKDVGANKEMMHNFLSKQVLLDEDEAKLFSEIVELGKEQDQGGF